MKLKSILIVAAPILLLGLSACHGRTTESVESNGETIDVVIDTVDTVPADTIE